MAQRDMCFSLRQRNLDFQQGHTSSSGCSPEQEIRSPSTGAPALQNNSVQKGKKNSQQTVANESEILTKVEVVAAPLFDLFQVLMSCTLWFVSQTNFSAIFLPTTGKPRFFLLTNEHLTLFLNQTPIFLCHLLCWLVTPHQKCPKQSTHTSIPDRGNSSVMQYPKNPNYSLQSVKCRKISQNGLNQYLKPERQMALMYYHLFIT